MSNMHTTLAILRAVAFAVVGGALVIATQTMFDAERLIELSAYVVMASVASALLAALAVFQLFSRRLTRLADTVETIAHGGFTTPLRVPGADPDGDEIGRLSMHVERMSDRIAEQLAELERAAGRRRELLANVSHDLRTPLASMQGYLELLLLRHGSLEPAEERNYLETAVRHSERLGRLVDELFELTRLEAEEVRLQPEDFSLAELAQDVVQKFALDARRREVGLQACGADDVAVLRVHADIGMVERVLENLLDNALRHTPAGGTVTIELELELERDAQRARVAVRDTGPGIAADDLTSVFERYERADGCAPGAHGGLGLAIARHIANLHGSELSVHSILGSGSCFAFDLPLAERRTAPTRSATGNGGRTTG